ncbi:MAG: response regulator transcription factor [Burkholderiaceae bacterium]|nr:response regulator transcription factor [Burkholderiaceae bacterium]MBP6816076.1 response regulator transcription factor [Burkholderiaceae bacterium]
MPPLKLFIVEDSALILESLRAALEELAPVVVVGSAADETSAVRWLLEPANAWDLAIVDVFLKSGSGLGVLASSARANVRGKKVVFTNYATRDVRERCQALGADRVFDKSSELDDLIDYCARLADRDAGARSAPPA